MPLRRFSFAGSTVAARVSAETFLHLYGSMQSSSSSVSCSSAIRSLRTPAGSSPSRSAIAAAVPTACPIVAHVAITRSDERPMCVQEMSRPARPASFSSA